MRNRGQTPNAHSPVPDDPQSESDPECGSSDVHVRGLAPDVHGPPASSYAVVATGSDRTMTVSTIGMISSAGSPARAACLRIASGLTPS